MDDVDCRRLDRAGEGSRELGLLRDWLKLTGSNGERDRLGVEGAKLLAADGDRGRGAVRVYGSETLRIRPEQN